jgi:hypothetical protein
VIGWFQKPDFIPALDGAHSRFLRNVTSCSTYVAFATLEIKRVLFPQSTTSGALLGKISVFYGQLVKGQINDCKFPVE